MSRPTPPPIPCVVGEVPVDDVLEMLEVATVLARGMAWPERPAGRAGDVAVYVADARDGLRIHRLTGPRIILTLPIGDGPGDGVTPEALARSQRDSVRHAIARGGSEEGSLRATLGRAAGTIAAACAAVGEDGARAHAVSCGVDPAGRFAAACRSGAIPLPASLTAALASIAPAFRTLDDGPNGRVDVIARTSYVHVDELSPMDMMRLVSTLPERALEDLGSAIATARAVARE